MKITHRCIMYAAIIVWLHTIIAILHGLSHVMNDANLSIDADVFVAVVIILAPLLALLLLRTHWQRSGALLLTLSMAASLLFGLWNHFIIPGSDNIAQVMHGTWYSSFLVTSILIAVLEAIGTGIGIWCLLVLEHSHVMQNKYRTGKNDIGAEEKTAH